MKTLTTFLLIALTQTASQAQENLKNDQLNSAQKTEAIQNLLKTVNDKYVFPELGKKIESYIIREHSKNKYKDQDNGYAFANQITADLQFVSNDKHLRLDYSPEVIPAEAERDVMSIPESEKESYSNMLTHINYGIRKLEVLRGNIGYIDFELFCDPEFAGNTYAAMMSYLEHTEALIIDLRQCSGSRSPDAIPFLCSYFFKEPVKVSETYWRKSNSNTQSWTYAFVPGKKYLNKPIYVLTSQATFSGAEALAMVLKVNNRATLIGKTTGGGANPGGYIRISDHFRAFVPVGRHVNQKNWEGTGVEPDTIINPRYALTLAQQLAMQNSINTTKEDIWRNALTEWSRELETSKPVLKEVTFELSGFPAAKEVFVTGTFNDWSSSEYKMTRKGDKWLVNLQSETGKIRYKFIVDGQWITDPNNPQTEASGNNIDSVRKIE